MARQLAFTSVATPEDISAVRRETETRIQEVSPYWRPAFRLCASLLCDLRGQGWTIQVDQSEVRIAPPGVVSTSALERKAQVRASHLIERDAQLSLPSTRVFVRQMEQRRLHQGEWHSIFSLMRDGEDLAATLAAAVQSGETAALRTIVDPYVQAVDTDAICKFTGLRLVDIWRYFRHTWTITHNSVPGRRMSFLIRDRAAPFHPIIGIGAIGSAIVQLGERDNWIGWTSAAFLARLENECTAEWATWVFDSLQSLIDGIAINDLITERIITRRSIREPEAVDISTLREFAQAQRSAHRLYPGKGVHKSSDSNPNWKTLSRTHLFLAKRAETLAALLEARRVLLALGLKQPNAKALHAVLQDSAGRKAIQVVLRQVKATYVGVAMMDITVCGSVAPYNALLGGKLVSLLMASPAVTSAYEKRYKNNASIIASAMAGRPIVRRPQLVLLGTTSLYDVASSQYNRIRVAANQFGGSSDTALQYLSLGRTEGVGSFHISRDTMEAIETLLARLQRGRPVNSIFGEGVNPKLRKVRSALEAVGLPSNELLTHGSPRIIYGIPLASNFRDVLIGRAKRAKFILPQRAETSERLADYWISRWLQRRVENPDVLASVATHKKTYPLRHGARVPLPALPGDDGPLFSDAVLHEDPNV